MNEEEMKAKFNELAEQMKPIMEGMTKLVRMAKDVVGVRIDVSYTDVGTTGQMEINVRTNDDPNLKKTLEMMAMLEKLARMSQGQDPEKPHIEVHNDPRVKDQPKKEAPPAEPILPPAMQDFLNNLGHKPTEGNA